MGLSEPVASTPGAGGGGVPRSTVAGWLGYLADDCGAGRGASGFAIAIPLADISDSSRATVSGNGSRAA